jgi:KDO2-lipid IV(A) lauroyltransferase
MSVVSSRINTWGYLAGWKLVRVLPAPVANTLFSLVADFAARRNGPGVRQLRKNLTRIVPQADPVELDELVRRSMRSYARYWCETFRLQSMDKEVIRRKVDAVISGVENLDAALAAGNGAVIVLPHSGNWDVAGLWLVGHLGAFTTVVERLKPESLYQRFVAYRESLGFEILPAAGGLGSFRTLLDRLRTNKVVCLVADRDLSRNGIPVNFFGEQTKMPGGAARLAATTGAALLPASSWFTEDGWAVRIHPRIRVTSREEIPAATQAIADSFAGDIAAHPADWHMLQKFWLEDFPDSPQIAHTENEEEAS